MYIELTEEQKKNLLIFFDRVDLKGKEAIAYVQILGALQKPIDIPKEGEE